MSNIVFMFIKIFELLALVKQSLESLFTSKLFLVQDLWLLSILYLTERLFNNYGMSWTRFYVNANF